MRSVLPCYKYRNTYLHLIRKINSLNLLSFMIYECFYWSNHTRMCFFCSLRIILLLLMKLFFQSTLILLLWRIFFYACVCSVECDSRTTCSNWKHLFVIDSIFIEEGYIVTSHYGVIKSGIFLIRYPQCQCLSPTRHYQSYHVYVLD